MNGFNPFPQAAPDFGDPLGLLRACHARITGHCDTLARLLPHLALHGADAEAREAMARVHRYFATAAQHHHEDEERDLFPLLRGREPALDALLSGLAQDHRELTARWSTLAPLLAAPEQASQGLAELTQVIAQFTAAYRAHAAKENEQLLPRAAQLLTADELTQLGTAMAHRRGVSHPG